MNASTDNLDFTAVTRLDAPAEALRRVMATDTDVSSLVLRLALGVMIFPHGAQKLVGWFGGFGFQGTMAFFTETMGIPALLALLAIVAEFFGGLALISGFMGRIAALGVGMVMLVAAWTSHVQNGFFMNWSGSQAGEGFEFHMLAVAIAAAIVLRGSGRWSVDRLLTS